MHINQIAKTFKIGPWDFRKLTKVGEKAKKNIL